MGPKKVKMVQKYFFRHFYLKLKSISNVVRHIARVVIFQLIQTGSSFSLLDLFQIWKWKFLTPKMKMKIIDFSKIRICAMKISSAWSPISCESKNVFGLNPVVRTASNMAVNVELIQHFLQTAYTFNIGVMSITFFSLNFF